ncbi:MAG: DNA ligase-like domain-containing protein [Sulfobacillus sp.]
MPTASVSPLEDSANFLASIQDRWKIDVLRTSHFKMIDGTDLPAVARAAEQHLVCFNTNQEKHLLFLGEVAGKATVVMINRQSMQCNRVQLRFSEGLFAGTLFEGELMRVSGGAPLFLISDLLADKGGFVGDSLLRERLARANEILTKEYHPDPLVDPYRLALKEHAELQQLRSFVKDFSEVVEYRKYVTGVIIRPVRRGKNLVVVLDRMNFHRLRMDDARTERTAPKEESRSSRISNVKGPSRPMATAPRPRGAQAPELEPVPGNSVFLVVKTDKPDVYELFKVDKEGNRDKCGLASVPTLEQSRKLRAAFQRADRLYFRCIPKNGKWVPAEQLQPDQITAAP